MNKSGSGAAHPTSLVHQITDKHRVSGLPLPSTSSSFNASQKLNAIFTDGNPISPDLCPSDVETDSGSGFTFVKTKENRNLRSKDKAFIAYANNCHTHNRTQQRKYNVSNRNVNEKFLPNHNVSFDEDAQINNDNTIVNPESDINQNDNENTDIEIKEDEELDYDDIKLRSKKKVKVAFDKNFDIDFPALPHNKPKRYSKSVPRNNKNTNEKSTDEQIIIDDKDINNYLSDHKEEEVLDDNDEIKVTISKNRVFLPLRNTKCYIENKFGISANNYKYKHVRDEEFEKEQKRIKNENENEIQDGFKIIDSKGNKDKKVNNKDRKSRRKGALSQNKKDITYMFNTGVGSNYHAIIKPVVNEGMKVRFNSVYEWKQPESINRDFLDFYLTNIVEGVSTHKETWWEFALIVANGDINVFLETILKPHQSCFLLEPFARVSIDGCIITPFVMGYAQMDTIYNLVEEGISDVDIVETIVKYLSFESVLIGPNESDRIFYSNVVDSFKREWKDRAVFKVSAHIRELELCFDDRDRNLIDKSFDFREILFRLLRFLIRGWRLDRTTVTMVRKSNGNKVIAHQDFFVRPKFVDIRDVFLVDPVAFFSLQDSNTISCLKPRLLKFMHEGGRIVTQEEEDNEKFECDKKINRRKEIIKFLINRDTPFVFSNWNYRLEIKEHSFYKMQEEFDQPILQWTSIAQLYVLDTLPNVFSVNHENKIKKNLKIKASNDSKSLRIEERPQALAKAQAKKRKSKEEWLEHEKFIAKSKEDRKRKNRLKRLNLTHVEYGRLKNMTLLEQDHFIKDRLGEIKAQTVNEFGPETFSYRGSLPNNEKVNNYFDDIEYNGDVISVISQILKGYTKEGKIIGDSKIFAKTESDRLYLGAILNYNQCQDMSYLGNQTSITTNEIGIDFNNKVFNYPNFKMCDEELLNKYKKHLEEKNNETDKIIPINKNLDDEQQNDKFIDKDLKSKKDKFKKSNIIKRAIRVAESLLHNRARLLGFFSSGNQNNIFRKYVAKGIVGFAKEKRINFYGDSRVSSIVTKWAYADLVDNKYSNEKEFFEKTEELSICNSNYINRQLGKVDYYEGGYNDSAKEISTICSSIAAIPHFSAFLAKNRVCRCCFLDFFLPGNLTTDTVVPFLKNRKPIVLSTLMGWAEYKAGIHNKECHSDNGNIDKKVITNNTIFQITASELLKLRFSNLSLESLFIIFGSIITILSCLLSLTCFIRLRFRNWKSFKNEMLNAKRYALKKEGIVFCPHIKIQCTSNTQQVVRSIFGITWEPLFILGALMIFCIKGCNAEFIIPTERLILMNNNGRLVTHKTAIGFNLSMVRIPINDNQPFNWPNRKVNLNIRKLFVGIWKDKIIEDWALALCQGTYQTHCRDFVKGLDIIATVDMNADNAREKMTLAYPNHDKKKLLYIYLDGGEIAENDPYIQIEFDDFTIEMGLRSFRYYAKFLLLAQVTEFRSNCGGKSKSECIEISNILMNPTEIKNLLNKNPNANHGDPNIPNDLIQNLVKDVPLSGVFPNYDPNEDSKYSKGPMIINNKYNSNKLNAVKKQRKKIRKMYNNIYIHEDKIKEDSIFNDNSNKMTTISLLNVTRGMEIPEGFAYPFSLINTTRNNVKKVSTKNFYKRNIDNKRNIEDKKVTNQKHSKGYDHEDDDMDMNIRDRIKYAKDIQNTINEEEQEDMRIRILNRANLIGGSLSRGKRGLHCVSAIFYSYCPNGITEDEVDNKISGVVNTINAQFGKLSSGIQSSFSEMGTRMNDKFLDVFTNIENINKAFAQSEENRAVVTKELESKIRTNFDYISCISTIADFNNEWNKIRLLNAENIQEYRRFIAFYGNAIICFEARRCDLFWQDISYYIPKLYDLYIYDKSWSVGGYIDTNTIHILYVMPEVAKFEWVTVPYKPALHVVGECNEEKECNCCIHQDPAVADIKMIKNVTDINDDYDPVKVSFSTFNTEKCTKTTSSVEEVFFLFRNKCVKVSCRTIGFVDINICFNKIASNEIESSNILTKYIIYLNAKTFGLGGSMTFSNSSFAYNNITLIKFKPIETKDINERLQTVTENIQSTLTALSSHRSSNSSFVFIGTIISLIAIVLLIAKDVFIFWYKNIKHKNQEEIRQIIRDTKSQKAILNYNEIMSKNICFSMPNVNNNNRLSNSKNPNIFEEQKIFHPLSDECLADESLIISHRKSGLKGFITTHNLFEIFIDDGQKYKARINFCTLSDKVITINGDEKDILKWENNNQANIKRKNKNKKDKDKSGYKKDIPSTDVEKERLAKISEEIIQCNENQASAPCCSNSFCEKGERCENFSSKFDGYGKNTFIKETESKVSEAYKIPLPSHIITRAVGKFLGRTVCETYPLFSDNILPLSALIIKADSDEVLLYGKYMSSIDKMGKCNCNNVDTLIVKSVWVGEQEITYLPSESTFIAEDKGSSVSSQL